MKLIIYCVAFITATGSILSQTTFSFGPLLAPKIGLNLSPQPNYLLEDSLLGSRYVKVEGQTSYDLDFGISLKMYLEHLKTTLFFDGSYTTTSNSYTLTDDNGELQDYTTKVHYLTISPNYTTNWIFFGLTLGLPISASTTNTSGSFSSDAENTDDLRMKADLKFGCLFPIVKSSLGELDLLLTGGLMIPPLFMDDPLPSQKYVVLEYDQNYSPRIFSFSVGLTYYFNILTVD
ncbi:MAG: hypothetical protein IPM69_10725 [Ignavibacteria bacterium]|nr:hypothetical protein [Ignavibacteria bacterium]